MWKFPRRLFVDENATDVDDFNEAVHAYGAESGRLTDHNTDGTVVGTLAADRVARMSRGIFGITVVKASTETNVPIVEGLGWVALLTATITTGPARLRAFANVEIAGTLSVPSALRLALQLDGVTVGESVQPIISGRGLSVSFNLDVPEGIHTVVVVGQTLNDPNLVADKTALNLFAVEK
jgi:hypothetical protein